MYARSAATMLPFGRRSARAASMSDVLASVTVMNAGRCPAWSSATCAFTPPFVRRNFAHGNIARHRSITVESSEYSGFLNRNPCPGDANWQRGSSTPNSAWYNCHGFSAFTRASDDRDTSPTPRWYSLRDCADRFDTMSRRLQRPVSCAIPIATNWSHRVSLRGIRPALCFPASASNSCLGNSLSNCPNIVLLCDTAWIPCVSIGFSSNTIIPHGAIQASYSQVNGTVVMADRMLPVDEIEAASIADELLRSPPVIGYLTISNALQWRLQYRRVIDKANTIGGIRRL